MTSMVPLAVVRYFAARTPDAIADCFTEDGVAYDEGRTHQGRAAIRRWRAAADKIDYRLHLLSADTQGDHVAVTCRIEGDFKGSPAHLDFRFELAGDAITTLEIS